MNKNNETEPILIFAGTAWEAGIVKSLLENAEVEAFLKDEIMGSLNPWWTAPGGAGSVKVFVSGLDFDKANEIVKEFERNIKEKDEL